MKLVHDKGVPSNTLQQYITDNLINQPIPFLQCNTKFYVRCSLNKAGEVFKNVERCSYPPDYVRENILLQRANYPKQQVFYCTMPTNTDQASASATAIVESCWEHIDDAAISRTYATLSRWETARPLTLCVMPFSEENCKKNNDILKIRDEITNLINEKIHSINIIQIFEFFSNLFCQRENKYDNYRITSAFYNSLLEFENFGEINLDGLMYPSANTEAAGINIVLKKELIDNKTLICSHVVMNSLQRMPNNRFHVKFMPASNIVTPDQFGNVHFDYIK